VLEFVPIHYNYVTRPI